MAAAALSNTTRSASLADATSTLADLLADLRGISPGRIRSWPAPRTATENDVLEIQRKTNRLFDVYTGDATPVTLHAGDLLDGGEVLPGFTIDVSSLFTEIGELPR